MVDELATKLPSSQVFPPLLALSQQAIANEDPALRRAGVLALGIAVEGCSEFMQQAGSMPAVWAVLEAGFRDPAPGVRTATCTAIGHLCEWMDDECSSRHAVLVPGLLSMMADPETQSAATTALDALVEILPNIIEQYLPVLMERLVTMLDAQPTKVKAVVTGAIGSAAHAAKARFLPYFAPLMGKLTAFLALGDDEGEVLELRGIAMDTIGTFAEAVGADAFRPYFPEMMRVAFAGVAGGGARLKECCFLLFGVLGRVFEAEFAPYLPQVVPALIASLKQAEMGEEVLVAAAGAWQSMNEVRILILV